MKHNLLSQTIQLLPLIIVAASLQTHGESSPALRKVGDLVIYQDDKFYSAFPSIVRRPDGELLVAFRRAPERRSLGEKQVSHTDPNSQLVLVRSRDAGKTWSQEPELIYDQIVRPADPRAERATDVLFQRFHAPLAIASKSQPKA